MVSPLARRTEAVIGSEAALAALRDAGERHFEGRLSGFRHVVMRSGGAAPGPLSARNAALVAAAAAAQRAALADPSPRRLHAWGLSQLLLGDYHGAVSSLRAAADQAETNAGYFSDLTAALLARAQALDQPEDLPLALEAAERARSLGDGPEIRYNRALALESLHLDHEAAGEWRTFLALAPDSAWHEEARSRLAALLEIPRAMHWSHGQPITERTAFRAREWMQYVGLPAWANAVLGNALIPQAQAAVVGAADALLNVTGDRIFEIIRNEVTQFEGARLRRLAAAHLRFTAGLTAVRALDAARMVALIDEACVAFREVGSRMRGACEAEAAHMRFQEGRLDVASAETARLLMTLKRDRLHLAQARVWWLRGRVLTLRQRVDDARGAYRRAREIAEATGEWVTAARMWSQESEVAYAAGNHDDYWRLRLAALDLTSQVQDATAALAAYASSAALLLRENRYLAAGVMAAAAAAPFGSPAPPGLQLPIIETNLVAAVQAADLDGARHWSQALEEQSHRFATDPRLASLRVNIDLARSRLAVARDDAPAAEALLTRALDQADDLTLLELQIRALTMRAEVRRQQGDSAAGWADVERATQLLGRRSEARRSNLRSAELAALRQVAARLTHSTPDPTWRHFAALDWANSSLTAGPELPQPGSDPPLVDSSVAIMMLVDDGQRLGAWILSAARLAFVPLIDTRASVIRLSHRLTLLAESEATGPAWSDTLTRLSHLLIDPIEELLVGVDHVIVVHDEATRGVPLAALLLADGRPVADRWTISRATSARAALASMPVTVQPRSVVAVADPIGGAQPQLPGARAEADAVVKLYPNVRGLFVGRDATVTRLAREIDETDVIHLATHAVANPSNPGRSYLQLAIEQGRDHGRWYLDEIGTERFSRHQIVVLAACRTAAGAFDRRDSAPTIAEAIVNAGAGWVFATLWNLSDHGSQTIFSRLHQHLAAGLPAPQALQQTVRELSTNPLLAPSVAAIEVFTNHRS